MTDPEVRHSFRRVEAGFMSRNKMGISCPPYIIAKLALDYHVTLPEGYTEDTLQRIMNITGWLGIDRFISQRQAKELAMIGEQLITLHEEKKLTLTFSQEQSVLHLLDEVKA